MAAAVTARLMSATSVVARADSVDPAMADALIGPSLSGATWHLSAAWPAVIAFLLPPARPTFSSLVPLAALYEALLNPLVL
jgi:hypothetical protein